MSNMLETIHTTSLSDQIMLNRISDLYGRFRAFSTDSAHIPKTEKFCRSGPVKFGEVSSNVKPAGNHPYYLLQWSDYVKNDIRLVGSI